VIAETRVRCLTVSQFATVSPRLLWTLQKVRRRLRHAGLEAAVDAATCVRRPASTAGRAQSEDAQRLAAVIDDQVISWWLVTMRVPAICLYRSLVMLERLSRLHYVETVELVLGVHAAAGGGMEDAHAWILVNGEEFQIDRSVWDVYRVICRFTRRPGAERSGQTTMSTLG
jgi:Transglutaminase-like superfamily